MEIPLKILASERNTTEQILYQGQGNRLNGR
jgi:hypothetical protein